MVRLVSFIAFTVGVLWALAQMFIFLFEGTFDWSSIIANIIVLVLAAIKFERSEQDD